MSMEANVTVSSSTTMKAHNNEREIGHKSIVSGPSYSTDDCRDEREDHGAVQALTTGTSICNGTDAPQKTPVAQSQPSKVPVPNRAPSSQYNGRVVYDRDPSRLRYPLPPSHFSLNAPGRYYHGARHRPNYLWMPAMPPTGPYSAMGGGSLQKPPIGIPPPRLGSRTGGRSNFKPYGSKLAQAHFNGYGREGGSNLPLPPPFNHQDHFIRPTGSDTLKLRPQKTEMVGSVSSSRHVPDHILVRQDFDNKVQQQQQQQRQEFALSKSACAIFSKRKECVRSLDSNHVPLLPSLSEPGPSAETRGGRRSRHRSSLSSDMILGPEFDVVKLYESNLSVEDMKSNFIRPTRTLKRRKVNDATENEREQIDKARTTEFGTIEKTETGDSDQLSMGSSAASTQTPSTSENQGKRLILTVSASPTSRAESNSSVTNTTELAPSFNEQPAALSSAQASIDKTIGVNAQVMMEEEPFDHEMMLGNHRFTDSFTLLPLIESEGNTTNQFPTVSKQLSWEFEDKTSEVRECINGMDVSLTLRDSSSANERQDTNSPEEFLEFPESPLCLNHVEGDSEDMRLCNMTPQFEMKLLNEPLNGKATPLFFNTPESRENVGRDHSLSSIGETNVTTPEHAKQILIAQVEDDDWLDFQSGSQNTEVSPAVTCGTKDMQWKTNFQLTTVASPETPLITPVSPTPLRTPLLSPVSPHYFLTPQAQSSKPHIQISKANSWGAIPSPMVQTPNAIRVPVWELPSRDRCFALQHPHPTKFQGDPAKGRDCDLPEFTALVNFPAIPAQKHHKMLPSGMKYCVMCGKPRSVCSRVKNKKSSDDPTVNQLLNTDPITIPIQNKGLCTLCDVNVWVVRANGMQIKWCKGCKNFRPWLAFGDKGLATKCVRCRARQREKYALRKDEKKANGLSSPI